MMARDKTVFALDEAQTHVVELGDDFTVGGGTVKKQHLLFKDLSTLSKSVSSADGLAAAVGSEIVHGVREGVQDFVETEQSKKKTQSQNAKAV